MTRDEHKQIVTDMLKLVTPENQASASEMLAKLTTDYEETLTGLETANASVTKLTSDFENLRRVNADLFLQVGNTKKTIHEEENNNDDNDDEENKMTFEALFNEKGDLI